MRARRRTPSPITSIPSPKRSATRIATRRAAPARVFTAWGALLDFNTLPCPQPQAIIQQSSTRDPNCGSDDYRVSDLGKSGNEWILMDSKRPGCLNRIYFGGTGTNIDNAPFQRHHEILLRRQPEPDHQTC